MEARLMAFLGIATVITVILGPDFDLFEHVEAFQQRKLVADHKVGLAFADQVRC